MLRAQLDRVQLKVDGTLQELWTKSNIGGPTSLSLRRCRPAPPFRRPDSSRLLGGSPSLDAGRSVAAAGPALQLPANLNVPLFSGFRVESNVKRAQALQDAATGARSGSSARTWRWRWRAPTGRCGALALLRDVQAAALRAAARGRGGGDGARDGRAGAADRRNRAQLRRLQHAATLADLAGQAREAAAQLGVALGVDRRRWCWSIVPPSPDAPPPPVDELLADAPGAARAARSPSCRCEAQHQAMRMAQSGYYPQLDARSALFQFGNNPFNSASGARAAAVGGQPVHQHRRQLARRARR